VGDVVGDIREALGKLTVVIDTVKATGRIDLDEVVPAERINHMYLLRERLPDGVEQE